jgi:hydrogenase maturation protease
MRADAPGEARPRILVVAVGNPDRGDDGVGPRVARKLSGRLPAEAKLVVRSGDMMSLIEDWAGFAAVIFVDAAAPKGAPGRVHRIDLSKEKLPPELSLTSSHAFGVAEAIELARVLDIAPKQIVVYAIEGACFDAGAPLTPAVLRAAAEVADCIAEEVCRISRAASETRNGAPHES